MGWARFSALSTLFLIVSLSAGARAQSNAALAESFFRDGKRLMSEKKFSEACPKLEESQRLDPGVGTLLNLGACYEGWGKVASAWARYSEAHTAAKRVGQNDRAELARERVRALEAELPMYAEPCGSRTDRNQPVDGWPVLTANWASKARL